MRDATVRGNQQRIPTSKKPQKKLTIPIVSIRKIMREEDNEQRQEEYGQFLVNFHILFYVARARAPYGICVAATTRCPKTPRVNENYIRIMGFAHSEWDYVCVAFCRDYPWRFRNIAPYPSGAIIAGAKIIIFVVPDLVVVEE